MSKVEPKFRGVTLGRIVVTAEEIKTDSGLILSGDPKTKKKQIKDIQSVIAVGPTVKIENGLDIKVGDKVMLNTNNPKMGYPVFFNKETGALAGPTDTEESCEAYFIIEAREVLMVF